MKTLSISAIALTCILGASNLALGADLGGSTKDDAYAIDGPVAHSWTGLYVGGTVGYGWGESTLDLQHGGEGFSSVNPKGAVGSLELGYNWQLDRDWLIGLEGEIGLMSLTDSATVLDGHQYNAKYGDWYGDIRGRVGFLATPAILLYATGGGAWMDNSTKSLADDGEDAETAIDHSRWGYVVGGGAEMKLSDHWRLKGEWLHFDFGNDSLTTGNDNHYTFHDKFDALRVGLNYAF